MSVSQVSWVLAIVKLSIALHRLRDAPLEILVSKVTSVLISSYDRYLTASLSSHVSRMVKVLPEQSFRGHQVI